MSPRLVRYDVESWGVGELWLQGERLIEHSLPRPNHSPNGPQGLPGTPAISVPWTGARDCADSVTRLVERIRRYFAGEPVDFADVELALADYTPFGRRLLDALRGVPYGEVVTYAELAALAGSPRAQRAAGTFCAHNRFALMVPCHRVVSAAGIGSYGSLGTAVKRRLLELEHVAV